MTKFVLGCPDGPHFSVPQQGLSHSMKPLYTGQAGTCCLAHLVSCVLIFKNNVRNRTDENRGVYKNGLKEQSESMLVSC